MVNRRMRPAQALSPVRKTARQHRLRVELLSRIGKGSHQIYALVDESGSEIARFGLTGHPRDLSWTVLNQLEATLAPWFGEEWTEKK